jgi:RHS repeat-associated protein
MTYEYDTGKLTKVKDATTTFADSLTFAPTGALTSETWGNSAVHTQTFNRAFQTSQVKLSVNGSEKQRYDYLYGAVTQSTGSVDTTKNTGQIARVDGTINGAATKEWDQRFVYDELGRLNIAAEYQNGTGSTPTWQVKYGYDLYGNRTQTGSSDNFGVPYVNVQTSDYDTTNHTNRFVATGTTPMTYDEAGNITQDMKFRMTGSLGMKYTYDANGRQATAKLSDNTSLQSSVYDGAGKRVQTTAGSTTRTMVYDIFGQDVADYTGSTSVTLERENIYRGGQLLATQDATPTTVKATWTNLIGVSASGNNLTKTASNGWGNAGASTVRAIAAGDGYAEFDPSSLDYGMYGLSNGDSNQSLGDIDFAIYTERAEGRVYVYEQGTNKGQVGTWTTGDKFRVAVESGAVKYYRNSTLLYTSWPTLTYPLLVDTSLYSGGNTLSNVVISGSLTGPGGVKYVLSDVQGSARALLNNNGSASVVMARHDYLPFGEEFGARIGTRRGSQGYGGADTNRQKYALTERDDATGLDHTWFRKYESLSGRMTSPDPYGGSMTIADPQSFNRYSYTQNDPVNFVDPSGLNEVDTIRIYTSEWNPWGNWLYWNYMFWEPPTGSGGTGDGGDASGEPLNSRQKPTIDFTKPECLPQQVKDTFKAAWKESGYDSRDNDEYSFSIASDPKTKLLAATTPESTHEFSAGTIKMIQGIVASAHTHGPRDLNGLSETDKDSAIKGRIAIYVMAPDGGLYLYDPANKATQKSHRDINRSDIDYAYGIRVGDLRGKNNFWDKPCK